MTPLVFSKAWLFNVGNLCRTPMSSVVIQNQQSMLAIKDVILGGAGQFGWTDQNGVAVAAPTFWTVYQSCDSVAFGAPGDLVDRLVTFGNVVWAPSGAAHSWIVLKSTSVIMGTTLYWLIACEQSGSDTNTIYMSTSKLGFSAAAGGTDGSTTLKPTAADEAVMRNSLQWGAGGGVPIRFHVLMSTDGSATRVFTTYQTNLMGFWTIEPLLDPTSGLDLFATVFGNAALNPLVVQSVSQTPQLVARTTGGAAVYGVLSGEGSQYASSVSAGLGAVDRVMWNDIAQVNQLLAVGAWGGLTSSPVARGHLGSLIDVWWGSNFVPCGRSFPNDYTRKVITMGPFGIPWNTTKAKVF